MPLTIVLVHGAFAGSTAWDRVIAPLEAVRHRVIAAANPLRGLASDAGAVSDLVRTIVSGMSPGSLNPLRLASV